MTDLRMVYALVHGQVIDVVLEDSETGARAEVKGIVTGVTGHGEVSLVARVQVQGRTRQLTAAGSGVPPDAPDAS